MPFFLDGSGTPIPVSKLDKDQGVQAHNVFSPSAHFTEAANKARRLIFMLGALPKISLTCPHLEYAMPVCLPNHVADTNRLERIEILATRLVTGMRYLPYEERLRRLSLHSLQRRRFRSDLITVFTIFTGRLDINRNIFLSPSRSTRPKRAPLKGAPRCEPPPTEREGIFSYGCEILE